MLMAILSVLSSLDEFLHLSHYNYEFLVVSRLLFLVGIVSFIAFFDWFRFIEIIT